MEAKKIKSEDFMNIILKSKAIDVLKDQLKEVANYYRYNSWNPEKRMKIDCASLTDAQREKVEKVPQGDELLNRNALNIIRYWERAASSSRETKAYNLESLATMLKVFISKIPKYALFRQSDDGDMLGYVVTKIGYKPPRRTRRYTEPAYTWVSMACHEQGSNVLSTVYFHQEDIKDRKSCAELVNLKGYVPATQEILRRYEDEVARYKELRSKVGHQVLGSGRCDVVGEERRWWGGTSRSETEASLDVDGRKTRLVVDIEEASDNDRKRSGKDADIPVLDGEFWKDMATERGRRTATPVAAGPATKRSRTGRR